MDHIGNRFEEFEELPQALQNKIKSKSIICLRSDSLDWEAILGVIGNLTVVYTKQNVIRKSVKKRYDWTNIHWFTANKNLSTYKIFAIYFRNYCVKDISKLFL